MFRNSFNGGEVSPALALRADMDAFHRGCREVVNFDIEQTGGVTRRRGFRRFARAQGEASRLFGYAYTNSQRFLVEVGTEELRVFDEHGTNVFTTDSPFIEPECVRELRVLQVNSLLLLTCPYIPPTQLVCDAQGVWRFELFSFKVPPWRYSLYREHPIVVTRREDGYFAVAWHEDEDVRESTPAEGEVLRASFYTEARNIKMSNAQAFATVQAHFDEGFIGGDTLVQDGAVIAVRRQPEDAVYSVTKEWKGGDHFVEGLIDPANYPTFFQLASDGGSHDATIAELSKNTNYAAGTRVCYRQGYWDLFTCISAFNGSEHARPEGINPEDYPGHFVRGLFMGSAPSKGEWMLYTSGTWYGSYEVRACYEGEGSPADEWEFRAECFSRNATPTNTPCGGDESSEECLVSLWLTRVRAYGETWESRNFPQDSCGNQLTVCSYKHDMMLRYTQVGDGDDAYFVCVDRVPVPWYGKLECISWSWSAFCSRYGYPRMAQMLNQRLYLSGTDAQPLTIWASRTDDLDNFDIVQDASSALAVTLDCQTQDPIRWMQVQAGKLMLGTADGEHVLQSAQQGGAIAYNNVAVAQHGYVGAASVAALQCSEKLVFFERGGSRVMQYGYDYSQDAFLSSDLTVFANHILADGGGVVEGCFLRKPESKAVLVRKDGLLALMTYNAMHQINAWHRYETKGRFLSVAMLPNGDAADTLYAVVEREEVREPEAGLPDPDVKDKVYYIEAMDDKSPYLDNGQYDYESRLLTTALSTAGLGRRKEQAAPMMLYLTHEAEVGLFEVTTDGERFSPIASNCGSKVARGWHKMEGFAHPDWERVVGFRAHGESGFGVLALQA